MKTRICPGCGKEFEICDRLRTLNNICCSYKCAGIIKRGDKNPGWKGDRVGYTALHLYIKKIFPKPNCCNNCSQDKPLDLANISNEYKRDVSDWEWLCRKCHMDKDGRNDSLREYSKLNKRKAILCFFCQKEFVPKRSSTKYCSISCGTKQQHRDGRFRTKAKTKLK